jgi:hypothetical protein
VLLEPVHELLGEVPLVAIEVEAAQQRWVVPGSDLDELGEILLVLIDRRQSLDESAVGGRVNLLRCR